MSLARSLARKGLAADSAAARPAPPPEAPAHWRRAAVVLLYHGSSARPDAARTAEHHMAALKAGGWFAEMFAGGLNGGPGAAAALAQADAPLVYAVPLFMSMGRFVREIIPARLGLDGPVTARRGRTIGYCRPVGTHPALADIAAARARRACGRFGLVPAETGLLLVGHGSAGDSGSAEAASACAAQLVSAGEFAEIDVAFLEEQPLLSRRVDRLSGRSTVVVGLFATRGVHAEADVRRLLGLEPDAEAGPVPAGGRVLYTGAVGADPAIADLVLACIREFDARHLRQDWKAGREVWMAGDPSGGSLSSAARQ